MKPFNLCLIILFLCGQAYGEKYTYCILGNGPSAQVMINTILKQDQDNSRKILRISAESPTKLQFNYLTYDYEALSNQLGILKDSMTDRNLADKALIRQGGFLSLRKKNYRTTSIYDFNQILAKDQIDKKIRRLTTVDLGINNYLKAEDVVKQFLEPNDQYQCDNLIFATGSHGVTNASTTESLAMQVGKILWGADQEVIKYVNDFNRYDPKLQPKELEGITIPNASYAQLINKTQMKTALQLAIARNAQMRQVCCQNSCDDCINQPACLACYMNGGNGSTLEYITIAKTKGPEYVVSYLGLTKDIPQRFQEITGQVYRPNIPNFKKPYFFKVATQKLNHQHFKWKNTHLWFVGDANKTQIYFRNEGVGNMLKDAARVTDCILKGSLNRCSESPNVE